MIYFITKCLKISKIGKLCEENIKRDKFYQKRCKMGKIGKHCKKNLKYTFYYKMQNFKN